jgi:hypothetical protein
MSQYQVDSGIYSALTNHASLISALGSGKIFNAYVPAGTGYPYIVFNQISSLMDYSASNQITEAAEVDYDVSILSTVLATNLTLAGLVKTALHNQALTVVNWGAYACLYQAERQFIEYPNNAKTPVWHNILSFRVLVAGR